MKVFTYHEAVININQTDERALIELWKKNWASQGFEPVVLGRKDAEKHEEFDESLHVLKQLPSVNPEGYDLACYLRWLAVAAQKEPLCIMSDYDVMNYSWRHPYANGALVVYENHVPSLVSGPPESFYDQFEQFTMYEPEPDDLHDGRPHCSDMTIIGKGAHDAILMSEVKHYGEAGWQDAKLVHYNNGSMGPAGKIPRFLHIPKLR